MVNNSRILTPPDFDFASSNKRALLVSADQIDVLKLIDKLQASTAQWDLYLCNDDAQCKQWINKVLPRMHKVLVNETFNLKTRKKIKEHPYFVKYSTYSQLTKELEL